MEVFLVLLVIGCVIIGVINIEYRFGSFIWLLSTLFYCFIFFIILFWAFNWFDTFLLLFVLPCAVFGGLAYWGYKYSVKKDVEANKEEIERQLAKYKNKDN